MWLQILINKYPKLLTSQIKKNLGMREDEKIKWFSPLEKDDYAEYRDQSFIDLLGVKLERVPLNDFWPKRGPQWDALGKSDSGELFLIEAKSHISEMISNVRAKIDSKKKIQKSLEKTKEFLNGRPEVDWSIRFYQYTNRLAHLYLLRELNKLPAYLVFIYFISDEDQKGPKTIDEWKGALKLLHSYLGIGRHKLKKFTTEVFIDINSIRALERLNSKN